MIRASDEKITTIISQQNEKKKRMPSQWFVRFEDGGVSIFAEHHFPVYQKACGPALWEAQERCVRRKGGKDSVFQEKPEDSFLIVGRRIKRSMPVSAVDKRPETGFILHLFHQQAYRIRTENGVVL